MAKYSVQARYMNAIRRLMERAGIGWIRDGVVETTRQVGILAQVHFYLAARGLPTAGVDALSKQLQAKHLDLVFFDYIAVSMEKFDHLRKTGQVTGDGKTYLQSALRTIGREDLLP